MSGVDLNGLRAAAEAVDLNADPWYSPETTGGRIETAHPEDVAYIAAANPAVILALLNRLESTEAAVERVRALAASMAAESPGAGRFLAQGLTDALEGTQGPAGDSVALGGASDSRGPVIDAHEREEHR